MRMKDWQILFVVWFAAIGMTVLCIGEFYMQGYFSKKYSAYGLTQEIIDSENKYVFFEEEDCRYLDDNYHFTELEEDTKYFLEKAILAIRNSAKFGYNPNSYGVDGGSFSGALNLHDIKQDKKCKDFLDSLYESLKHNVDDESFIRELGIWLKNNFTYEEKQHDLFRGTKTFKGNCQVYSFIVKEMMDRHGFETSYFINQSEVNHIAVVYKKDSGFYVVDYSGVRRDSSIDRMSRGYALCTSSSYDYGVFIFGNTAYYYDRDATAIYFIDLDSGQVLCTQRWSTVYK